MTLRSPFGGVNSTRSALGAGGGDSTGAAPGRKLARVRTSTTFRRLGRSLAGAGLALACAVNAGPAAAAPAKLDLSRLSSRYDAAQARKAAGIADTAIDRSLQGGAATASVGFLCGLQPSTQTSGAAGALGVDREGRFLGAQLRLGFR